MKKMQLGNSKEKLSQFVLGTMLMGTAMSKEDSFIVMDDFISRGGDFLDTANCYAWWQGRGEYCGDESENTIGEWLLERNNRKDIFLATKIGARLRDHTLIRDKNGLPLWGKFNPRDHYEGASKIAVEKAVADSLKRLRTDYIDLLYIHADDRNTPLEETLETLDGLIKQGTVRFFGLSNFQTWRMEVVYRLCRQYGWALPVAVQQEYSYINPAKYRDQGITNHVKEDQFDWLDCHKEVSPVAYSPLLKGIYGGKTESEEINGRAKAFLQSDEYDSRVSKERWELVREISREKGISPNTLVLSWIAARKEGVFPVLGFSKKEQYYENIEAVSFEPDRDILDRMNLL